MGELPSENIYDILSRLPVKSLARFRCVSKQWCNYIRDPYLDIMRTKHGVIEDPMVIMFHEIFPRPPCPVMISLLESKEAETGALNLTKNPTVTMKFTSRERRSKRAVVLGSCKGLFFLRDETKVVVINPLRKECYQVPPIKMALSDRQHYVGLALGFDDSSNNFKMVFLASSTDDVVENPIGTMIHVLGSDSWRVIGQIPSHPIRSKGVFANRSLYWLPRMRRTTDDLSPLRTNHIKPIICFDVRKEEFGLINLPKQISSISWEDHLVDLDGQVGFVNNNFKTVTKDLWVLKQIGWVMHCSLNINYHPRIRWNFKVLGFWNKDGDILISNPERREWVFVYNLKSGVCHETNLRNLTGRKNGYVTDIHMNQSSTFSICYSINNFL